MIDVQIYKESMEIEFFIKGQLNIKEGTRQYQFLKGAFKTVVDNENGRGLLTKGQQTKHSKRLVKSLLKVADKQKARGQISNQDYVNIQEWAEHTEGSNTILRIYSLLKRD